MIYILYRQGATVHDIIESYAHAFELKLLLSVHNEKVWQPLNMDSTNALRPSID